MIAGFVITWIQYLLARLGALVRGDGKTKIEPAEITAESIIAQTNIAFYRAPLRKKEAEPEKPKTEAEEGEAENDEKCEQNATEPKQSKQQRQQVEPHVLMIIFSWLHARERHLRKYREIYHARGYDILVVRTTVLDVLHPPSGAQRVARNIAHYLLLSHRKYDVILVHAFSIGTYQYGEVLVQLARLRRSPPPIAANQHEKLKTFLGVERKKSEFDTDTLDTDVDAVTRKIAGQIYDSGVDVDEALDYFTHEIIRNKIMGFAAKMLILCYLKVAHDATTKQHRRSSDYIHRNNCRSPTLLFLSSNDPAVNESDQRQFARTLVRNNIPCMLKCWPESLHVGHYLRYPAEYKRFLNNFLDRIVFRKKNISHIFDEIIDDYDANDNGNNDVNNEDPIYDNNEKLLKCTVK